MPDPTFSILLYQMAMQAEKPTLCRFRDALPDSFRSSEYYRQYCERTHLLDEMDFLAEVSPQTTLALVVGRRTRRFTRTELQMLELVEPTVQACIRQVWQRQDRAAGHRASRRACIDASRSASIASAKRC